MSKKRILREIQKGMIACAAVGIILSGGKKDIKAEIILPDDTANAEYTMYNEYASTRSTTYRWVYKKENGKKYARLYDATNERWVTDWILCG